MILTSRKSSCGDLKQYDKNMYIVKAVPAKIIFNGSFKINENCSYDSNIALEDTIWNVSLSEERSGKPKFRQHIQMTYKEYKVLSENDNSVRLTGQYKKNGKMLYNSKVLKV